MRVESKDEISITLGDPRWNGDPDGGGEQTFVLSRAKARELRDMLNKALGDGPKRDYARVVHDGRGPG